MHEILVERLISKQLRVEEVIPHAVAAVAGHPLGQRAIHDRSNIWRGREWRRSRQEFERRGGVPQVLYGGTIVQVQTQDHIMTGDRGIESPPYVDVVDRKHVAHA